MKNNINNMLKQVIGWKWGSKASAIAVIAACCIMITIPKFLKVYGASLVYIIAYVDIIIGNTPISKQVNSCKSYSSKRYIVIAAILDAICIFILLSITSIANAFSILGYRRITSTIILIYTIVLSKLLKAYAIITGINCLGIITKARMKEFIIEIGHSHERLGAQVTIFEGYNQIYSTHPIHHSSISQLTVDKALLENPPIGLSHLSQATSLGEEETKLNLWSINLIIWRYYIIDLTLSTDKLLSRTIDIERQAEIKLSSFAHELRNPLNPLSCLLNTVKEDIKTDQGAIALKHLKIAKYQVKHALLIAKSPLYNYGAHSDSVRLNLTQFRLFPVLNSLFHMFKNDMKSKDLIYEILYESNLPEMVTSDKVRLSQILINLISNAYKFTLTGKISLKVTKYMNYYLQFVVQDTGIGIKKEHINNIGKAFSKPSQDNLVTNADGIGLGLMISNKIARLMGSQLRFESIENQGATFWFIIAVNNANPE